MAKFFVQTTSLRPDFRLVITFLWGDYHNCNTDGDSNNPASRDWTEFYCRNRENSVEAFDVSPIHKEPLLLQVESHHAWLAARVAYFLSVESAGVIAEHQEGPFAAPEALVSQMGDFDLAAAMQRVRRSPFQKATRDNPYPNLRDG